MKCTLYLGTSLSRGLCFSRHYTLQLNWKANVLTVKKKEWENHKLWKHDNNLHCIKHFVYQKPEFTLCVLSRLYSVAGQSVNTTVKSYESQGGNLSTMIMNSFVCANTVCKCSQKLVHKTYISTLSTRTPQGSVASSRNNWLKK